MTKLSPSILAADFANLGAQCRTVLDAGADMLHFDVMDGHFVPNISFGVPVLASLHKALPGAFYDVHLMISDPVGYAAAFAKAGASCITFHVEAVNDPAAAIRAIRGCGVQVGISLKPATPVESIFPLLGLVDLVLVMSVEPGFGGQTFQPGAVDRIAAIRAACRQQGVHPHLSVDGGINADTGARCAAAGADVLVAGSMVFSAADPAAAVAGLRAL
ncbi:ribulose-phosphate 3-epimerase [uncultured Gemmiger sp.]|uniref:ribulose-phosphate 3-epimerase n=1 Tax=uncultured Gemmiger sp. TaxID=1623490 RepID=UPI0025F56142|nr:ribulose-phosphate 3-epimerase [uncultured Gemmiger sp.]